MWMSYNQPKKLPTYIGEMSCFVKLNLDNNQLTSLPPTIGCLSALRQLRCAENVLTSLPPSINELVDLEELRLPLNKLSAIPIELFELSNLRQLRLSHNQLHSLIDSPSIPLDSLNSTLYFSIVVSFVNQAPNFLHSSNIIVNFTANSLLVKDSFLTSVSAGPASEDWQKVYCKLEPLADYSRSFVVSPFVAISGSTGTLFLQLAYGRHGTFLFTLSFKDDGGVANVGADAAQPVVVSFVAPFINSPPSLDLVFQTVTTLSHLPLRLLFLQKFPLFLRQHHFVFPM
jgi:hypothetical protein